MMKMTKLELVMAKPAKNQVGNSTITISLSYLVGGFIPLSPYTKRYTGLD